jgi:hypothetical protein
MFRTSISGNPDHGGKLPGYQNQVIDIGAASLKFLLAGFTLSLRERPTTSID